MTVQSSDVVLLVDDNEEILEKLEDAVAEALRDTGIKTRIWSPNASDKDPVQSFQKMIEDRPLLVVTDYDLTSRGRLGLFGTSIVALAQREAIPVGDYSRDVGALTDEPDVFEFRIPNDASTAGPYIGAIARGFQQIRDLLIAQDDLLTEPSPANMLADMLGRPAVAGPFSLYSSRLGSGNAALGQLLRSRHTASNDLRKLRLNIAAYISGHLLFNSILRYPGPLLHSQALAAYVAAAPEEADRLSEFFASARYQGPFAGLGPYFWQSDIDDKIEQIAREKAIKFESGSTFDVYRRSVVEAVLPGPLTRHPCKERCKGERGGYWCPFTRRPVCDRDDCSLPSSSWIPEGASLTRVEHDFYEEWPVLMGF